MGKVFSPSWGVGIIQDLDHINFSMGCFQMRFFRPNVSKKEKENAKRGRGKRDGKGIRKLVITVCSLAQAPA